MRCAFPFFLFIIIGFTPLKAQIGLSAELSTAYPLYFKDAGVGLTTRHLEEGFRLGAYYYGDFGADFCSVFGIRFAHHFTTTDSATVGVTGRSFYNEELHGTGKSEFNSIIPQLGWNFRSNRYQLLCYRFTVGMGVSWARCLYDFPTFDVRTMEYSNPPWWAAGKFNSEGKLVSIRPCMVLDVAAQYELEKFFVYGNVDITYSMGDFPSSPVALSVGILYPLGGKE